MFLNRKILNRISGWTLMEIMIAMAIILSLTAISVGSYRVYQRSLNFRGALKQLEGDLKQLQQMSITNPYPAEQANMLNPVTYRLQSDADNKGYTLEVCDTTGVSDNEPPRKIIKTVRFPGDIMWTEAVNLRFQQLGVPVNAGQAETVILTLRKGAAAEEANDVKKSITINASGAITAEKY
ncbi:MAG TPA: hypothetical protein PL110_01035 [Candidatus Eremiobacteraeota bacterium]|nr:MAG: hypothetical protein BWY64_03329 [bacterium ADurb.Bin363]HPZ06670.1 hypothetical protein [Candidatus Eremiobacteraeota bacterium]